MMADLIRRYAIGPLYAGVLMAVAGLFLAGCMFVVHGNFKDPPLVLVLPSEAELAGMPIKQLLGFRSQQEGPRIVVNSPQTGETYTAPVAIDIRFEPRDDADVDLNSLKVVYVKLIKIDITERVAPYASTDGITVPQADLPAGNHTLILSIADAHGKTSSQIIHVKIKDKS
jgi:hypothetical protein